MRIIILAILFSLSTTAVLSQSLYYQKPEPKFGVEASTLFTRSIRGTKAGFEISFSLKNRWYLSYFNLKSFKAEVGIETFEGVMAKRLFKLSNKLQMGPGLRIGFYNENFLSVLPSIQTAYQINDKASLGAGIARSDGYPHFNLALSFKIFRKE